MQNFRNRFAYWGVYALLFQFGQGILLAAFLAVGEVTWSWKVLLSLFSFPAMAFVAAAHPGIFEFAKSDSSGSNSGACGVACFVGVVLGAVAMGLGAPTKFFVVPAVVITSLVLLIGVIGDAATFRTQKESALDLLANTGLSMAIGVFALGGPYYGALTLIVVHLCAAVMYRLRSWSIASLSRFEPPDRVEQS